MNNLDKKLNNILNDHDARNRERASNKPLTIRQIKQALEDTGWKQHKNPVIELADDQTAILARHVVSKMLFQEPVMTGQEWYDKFKQDLYDQARWKNLSPDEYPRGPEQVLVTVEEVLQSAKKAAGIK